MSLSLPNQSLIGFDDQDYNSFCKRATQKLNLRLEDYKPDQMHRRVSSMAEREGCSSFNAYLSLMERDTRVLSSFLDQVTINVTELVRNPGLFADLFDRVLPSCPTYTSPAPLSIWSAGCSYGAEAYSMAMLLNEKNPGRLFKVRGTDIDLTTLAKANSPSFTEQDMVNVSPDLRKKYFNTMDEKTYTPLIKLKSSVTFSRQDLLGDEYPTEMYDLILCRNVIIYFTDDAKNRIYANFFKALKPGGILFIGGTERLADHTKFGFELMRPFFYQKPAAAGRLRLAA